MKKVKAILEEELLNGEVVKKGEVIEVEKGLADYLVRAYANHWQLVDEKEGKAEAVEEKKVEKKASKKSK